MQTLLPLHIVSSNRTSRREARIGLAIAPEAARLLGTELRVESQLGVGSVFRIALCHAPRPAAGMRAAAIKIDMSSLFTKHVRRLSERSQPWHCR